MANINSLNHPNDDCALDNTSPAFLDNLLVILKHKKMVKTTNRKDYNMS